LKRVCRRASLRSFGQVVRNSVRGKSGARSWMKERSRQRGSFLGKDGMPKNLESHQKRRGGLEELWKETKKEEKRAGKNHRLKGGGRTAQKKEGLGIRL